MKRLLAFILMLTMCVSLLVPFATLSAAAATTTSNVPTVGTVLWKETFGTAKGNTSDTLAQLNKTTDTYNFANWSVLSGSTTSALKIENGALKVDASSANLLVQLFQGTDWNTYVKSNDFTLSFDLTYTAGAADDYMGIRFARKDDSNMMETAVRIRGNGWMEAVSGGTKYSLEDDGVKATAAEVLAGTTSKGHSLLTLRKTSGGDTLLTRLNKTNSSISATYSSSATALMNKKLSFRLESIHGAGLTLAINGVVVTTTIKNVYYYDLLTGSNGTLALFFSAGTKATIDNLTLTAGGAYTITTNDLGLKIMDVNTLFSSSSQYSMHWIVDENGRLRMDALLDVIALHDPDIIGWQERSFVNPSGSGSENTIVETLVSRGYGIINNKTPLGQETFWGDTSRYDTYNWQPIFYKTSKFIAMNDSAREDEYIKGGAASLNPDVTSGNLLFDKAHYSTYHPAFTTDKVYNVQLVIGAQTLPSGTKAVQVRHFGRMFTVKDAPQKTVKELHYTSAVPTEQTPVTISSTSGWLDVSAFNDTQMANVTYNSSTKKVVYNGTSYTGAYYRRYGIKENIAVLLTDNTARYNPDSNAYRIFHSELYNVPASYFGTAGTPSASFPLGHTAKNVTELRTKGNAYQHTDNLPVTITAAEQTSGKYLNVTFFTQAQYNSVVMKGDGTTACTYNGVEYDGMFYVRARMEAAIGRNDSKGLTWSVLKLREGGQEILIMNVHCALLLGSQNPLSDGYYSWVDAAEWRVDNARQIIEIYNKVTAKHGKIPTILTGDFNMQNSDPMYAKLSSEFDDTARLAPGVIYWEYTHHEPTLVLTPTGQKDEYGNIQYYYNEGDITHLTYPDPNYPIDHIFVSPMDFNVTRYNVLNDTRDELLMTDHCAIVTELTFSMVFKPSISHKSGVYTDLQTVTITPAMTGDVIYYTTDGSDPSDESNAARKVYTKALKLCGDKQLKAVSCRNGVYSTVNTVTFSVCADLAITEIICNPKGAAGAGNDIQEGFEVVNVSKHPIDLADYIFWCQQEKEKVMLEDGSISYTIGMGHLRVHEKGRYIMQPGDVFFLWTVMDDAYKYKLQYTSTESAYAVEFVTAEKLADPTLREGDWEALGYTNLTEESIGKVIYRTDLIAEYFNKNTYRCIANPVDASQIVPLEKTTAAALYENVGTSKNPVWQLVESRKDVADQPTAPKVLSNSFNMGNSVYTRMFITYADALTAENAFATAILTEDTITTSSKGIAYDASLGYPIVSEGTFTMMPTLDTATGKITSYSTAFNAQGSFAVRGSYCSIGSLNTAGGTSQKQVVSDFVSKMNVAYYTVTVDTNDAATSVEDMIKNGESFTLPTTIPTGTGVFFGWKSSTGKLYAPGAAVTVTGELSFVPFFAVFATLPGASMRTTTGSVGLRFSSTIDREGYEELASLVGGESKLKKGTYIVPQLYVDRAGGFDVKKFPMKLDVVASGFRAQDMYSYTIAGSIANILEKNYRLSFAGCAYFSFTYADGSEALIYAAFPEGGSRTVVNVAAQAYNDRSTIEDAKYKYYCETENNYSPYTLSQRNKMLPFLSSVCYVSHGFDFGGEQETYEVKLTGSSAVIEATCRYDVHADALVITRSDGVAWNLAEVFVNGERTTDYAVSGDRLVIYLDNYTDEY